MKGHSGDNGDAAVRDDGVPKPLADTTTPGARRMSLEGEGALDLYLAKIASNASELQAQAALLQEALRERAELLRELQSSRSDNDERSR
jgi:hypothetical protein